MENNFAVRLVSPAGFSRIEVPRSSTFIDLKKAISLMVNVHIKEQKIFYDVQSKRPIDFNESTPVMKLGLK